jgi:RNA polymerase-binding transcription factor DksA
MSTSTTHLNGPTSASSAEVQLSVIRAELERERSFRVDQIHKLAADAAEAVAVGDDARLQVTRVLAVAAEAALTEISGALCRLDAGSYGICERCTEPIPGERLEVLPTSRFCTPCQSRSESRGSRGRSTSRSWPVAGPADRADAGPGA